MPRIKLKVNTDITIAGLLVCWLVSYHIVIQKSVLTISSQYLSKSFPL